jgi:hypothetical protein
MKTDAKFEAAYSGAGRVEENAGVKLTVEALNRLRELASDCVCHNCLKKFAQKYAHDGAKRDILTV